MAAKFSGREMAALVLSTNNRELVKAGIAEIRAAIGAVTRTRPIAHWLRVLPAAGIPCGPINTIDQVFADPQVRHLGIARPVAHPRLGPQQVVASPLTLSGVAKDIRSAAPDRAADTDAVLGEVGYSAAEIAALRASGVI